MSGIKKVFSEIRLLLGNEAWKAIAVLVAEGSLLRQVAKAEGKMCIFWIGPKSIHRLSSAIRPIKNGKVLVERQNATIF